MVLIDTLEDFNLFIESRIHNHRVNISTKENTFVDNLRDHLADNLDYVFFTTHLTIAFSLHFGAENPLLFINKKLPTELSILLTLRGIHKCRGFTLVDA